MLGILHYSEIPLCALVFQERCQALEANGIVLYSMKNLTIHKSCLKWNKHNVFPNALDPCWTQSSPPHVYATRRGRMGMDGTPQTPSIIIERQLMYLATRSPYSLSVSTSISSVK